MAGKIVNCASKELDQNIAGLGQPPKGSTVSPVVRRRWRPVTWASVPTCTRDGLRDNSAHSVLAQHVHDHHSHQNRDDIRFGMKVTGVHKSAISLQADEGGINYLCHQQQGQDHPLHHGGGTERQGEYSDEFPE